MNVNFLSISETFLSLRRPKLFLCQKDSRSTTQPTRNLQIHPINFVPFFSAFALAFSFHPSFLLPERVFEGSSARESERD